MNEGPAMQVTPEMRLLVQCLPSAATETPWPISPNATFDWDRLIELAGFHGMFPLLVTRLLTPGALSAVIPPAVLSRLRANQAAYVGRSVTQLAALAELQREFDREHLRIVAWKGPSAGLLLYGSATLRESADLDFLFLEEDLQPVLKIARRLGYDLLGSCDTESKDIYILTRMREFTFGRKSDQAVLEFHLQIMPSRFTLWQDSQADIERADHYLQLGDVTLLLQRPQDLLVSLCAHATKHNWDRLKWSADIAQFLKRYATELDWNALITALEPTGKHLVVLLGLTLAERLYGEPLPPVVAGLLQRTPDISILAQDVVDHVMSGETEPSSTEERKALADLLCPRRRDRLAYTFIPIVELNYEDLYVPVHNRFLFFINYLFRVVRLLRKYGPQRLAVKTAGSVRSVH